MVKGASGEPVWCCWRPEELPKKHKFWLTDLDRPNGRSASCSCTWGGGASGSHIAISIGHCSSNWCFCVFPSMCVQEILVWCWLWQNCCPGWQTGAASIIAEEEIEDRWCNIVVSVSTALAVQTPPYHMTRLQQWRASLYNTEVLCSWIALNCSSFMLHPFEHCVNYMLMQTLLGKTRSICSSLTFNRVSYLPLVGYFDIECIGAAWQL